MSKTVLITGASSGFGDEAAKRFAQDGCRLILAARSLDRSSALAESLSGTVDGGAIHISGLDVTRPESVDAFFEALPMAFRDIDVLVNSAGLALGLAPAHAVDFEDWQTMIDTNIT